MILGIYIKINNNNYYSKPLIITDTSDIFIAQLIRDVDFSFIANKNDNIYMEIIEYPNKNSYYDANIKNNINFKKFGSYSFIFNGIQNLNKNLDFITDNLSLILNETHNLKVTFHIVYRKIENDYILSTPTLSCKKDYFY
jgi:hypothetical protein